MCVSMYMCVINQATSCYLPYSVLNCQHAVLSLSLCSLAIADQLI